MALVGAGVVGLVLLDWWSFGVGGLWVTWFQSINPINLASLQSNKEVAW